LSGIKELKYELYSTVAPFNICTLKELLMLSEYKLTIEIVTAVIAAKPV
jgi:hypothetical protein